jgi:hypothetical protein
MRYKTTAAKLNILTTGSILILLLPGCSNSTDSPENKDSGLTSTLSTQLEAINKAKGVEGTLQDSFDKRDRLMDAQAQ